MAVFLLSVAVSCFITFIAVAIYVLSSFGNGMIFHMGWQVCARLSGGSVCNGEISTATIMITIAAFFLLPIQLYMLLDMVDWKLGINLSFTQQIGVFLGMYVSFTVHSDWLARGLGMSMMVVAVQKTFSEIKSAKAGEAKAAIQRFEFSRGMDYLLVWIVGISSGFFGGLYAAGGPPLMWFVATTNLDKNVCRGTVAFLYLIENFGRMFFIYIFSPNDAVLVMPWFNIFALCVALACTSFCALYVGTVTASRVDQQCFRYLILAMLGVGSVLLITTGYTAVESLYIFLCTMVVYFMLFLYYVYSTKTGNETTDDPDIILNNIELIVTAPDKRGSIGSIKYTAVECDDIDDD
jgi:uncharacterized membrane protein YfcA